MEPRSNRLFLPSARATNVLLVVGFGALGYALYVRYLGIEQSAIGLACNAGLDTWMCTQRRVLAALFDRAIIGWAAVIIAAVNLLRPTLVVFGLGLAVACVGVVLYNVMLSALAIGLLLLSFARRAPEPD
ncbi:hypothetical protein ASD45_09675 [Pseudolabrys sp. Root1462]|jgi:hypothetical protein|uniref:hypothetical protein n=1 Tax=Pseudolabrys sp. Root1462 TaxID=1736466 RepID=UPI000703AC58|nr:hypothetical protein [Pseudolabrys sp. Root1462]KQZ01101.1 hypothetical protein ASD45_09675 [Pseudolabrys sp. Root1462]